MPRKLSWDERCAEDAEGPVRLWSGAPIPSGAMGAQRPLKPLVARSNRASGTILEEGALIPGGAMEAQRPLKPLVARSTRASGTIPAALSVPGFLPLGRHSSGGHQGRVVGTWEMGAEDDRERRRGCKEGRLCLGLGGVGLGDDHNVVDDDQAVAFQAPTDHLAI